MYSVPPFECLLKLKPVVCALYWNQTFIFWPLHMYMIGCLWMVRCFKGMTNIYNCTQQRWEYKHHSSGFQPFKKLEILRKGNKCWYSCNNPNCPLWKKKRRKHNIIMPAYSTNLENEIISEQKITMYYLKHNNKCQPGCQHMPVSHSELVVCAVPIVTIPGASKIQEHVKST